jgi:hypothetical protein
MAIEDTKTLKTVRNETQAQELLDAGWKLLGLFDRRDGNDQYVEYHLGNPSEPAKGFFD